MSEPKKKTIEVDLDEYIALRKIALMWDELSDALPCDLDEMELNDTDEEIQALEKLLEDA